MTLDFASDRLEEQRRAPPATELVFDIAARCAPFDAVASVAQEMDVLALDQRGVEFGETFDVDVEFDVFLVSDPARTVGHALVEQFVVVERAEIEHVVGIEREHQGRLMLFRGVEDEVGFVAEACGDGGNRGPLELGDDLVEVLPSLDEDVLEPQPFGLLGDPSLERREVAFEHRDRLVEPSGDQQAPYMIVIAGLALRGKEGQLGRMGLFGLAVRANALGAGAGDVDEARVGGGIGHRMLVDPQSFFSPHHGPASQW